MKWPCSISLVLLMLTAMTQAAPKQKTETTPAWIIDVFNELSQERNIKQPVEFVFDNNIWLPENNYKNNSQWLALNCTAEKCTLEPATLTVKPELWQGHYDDKPTKGQKLSFSKNEKTQGKVVVWFKANTQFSWLSAREVTTYYSKVQPLKRPNSQGAFEAKVTTSAGESFVFVPLLYNSKDFKGVEEYSRYDGNVVFLQLRTATQRQFLQGTIGDCDGEIPTGHKRYLQWAGDLDLDGKADFIISFVDADGPVHLYLSSYANKEQMVGLAGVHDTSPYGGECDGGGWYLGNELNQP